MSFHHPYSSAVLVPNFGVFGLYCITLLLLAKSMDPILLSFDCLGGRQWQGQTHGFQESKHVLERNTGHGVHCELPGPWLLPQH